MVLAEMNTLQTAKMLRLSAPFRRGTETGRASGCSLMPDIVHGDTNCFVGLSLVLIEEKGSKLGKGRMRVNGEDLDSFGNRNVPFFSSFSPSF